MKRTVSLFTFVLLGLASTGCGADAQHAEPADREPATPPTANEVSAVARAQRAAAAPGGPAAPAADHPAPEDTRPSAPPPSELTAEAKELYAENCAACHGESGRGDGPLAAVLGPPPRDFGTLAVKFAGSARGVPEERELVRVLVRGVPGAGMPPATQLSAADRSTVAGVVRRLAFEARRDDLLAEDDELSPVEASEIAASLVAPGPAFDIPPRNGIRPQYPPHRLFSMYCAECHADDGTAVGAFDSELFDDAGWPLRARDLTREPLKGGGTERDIAMRIRRGIPGTPMPETTVRTEHLWALVDQVLTLRESAPPAVPPGAPVALATDGAPAPAALIALYPLVSEGKEPAAATLRLSVAEGRYRAEVRVRPSQPGVTVHAALRFSAEALPAFAWTPDGNGERATPWRTDGVAAAPAPGEDGARTIVIEGPLVHPTPVWTAIAVWESRGEQTGGDCLSGWHAVEVRR